MTSTRDDIGGRLRAAREQRGLTLRDLANRTKLAIAALRAIERNDFEALPGGLYAKAYVRIVAGELGLDAGEFAREYAAQFEPQVESVPPRRQGRLAQISDHFLSAWPSLAWLAGRDKSKVQP